MLFSWLRRYHQRRVLRRLTHLNAQIARLTAEKERREALAARCNNDFHDTKCIALAGEIARLTVIRAHNLQHEDTL